MNTKIKLLLKYEQDMYDTISNAQNTFIEKKSIITKFYDELERAAENHMIDVCKHCDENGVELGDEDEIDKFIEGIVYFWIRDFDDKNPIVKYSDGTPYNDNEKLAHSVKYFGIGYWK